MILKRFVGGVGVVGAVAILAKLTGIVAWNWPVVLLPFWGSACLVLLVVGCFLAYALWPE